MKRKIYLLILSIITIMCIFIGTFKMFNNKNAKNEETLLTQGDGTIFSINENFTSLDFDIDVGTVIIQYGEKASVHYSARVKPKITVQNGTLKITSKRKGIFFGKTKGDSFVITLPKDLHLNKLEGESDVGNIFVNGITARIIDIESDVGKIKIEATNTSVINAKTDVGNIDIIIEESLQNAEIFAKTDVGKIQVQNNKMGNKFSQNATKNARIKITAKSDVGDINISQKAL